MPQTMIDQIRAAEQTAEQMKVQAAAQARDQVRAAEEETLAWKEGQLMAARARSRATVEAAEAAARQRLEADDLAGRQAQDRLRRQAAGRMDGAVALVLERIVK